jgi:hypothetical protein
MTIHDAAHERKEKGHIRSHINLPRIPIKSWLVLDRNPVNPLTKFLAKMEEIREWHRLLYIFIITKINYVSIW